MRQNIIVILCDQLRPDFLNIYGCDAIPTPNLDKLAAQGVVFDRAITSSPVCAPARASMMTGRYPSDHEVWTNDIPFRDGVQYLPQLMNDLGYKTGCFGKLHHFPADDAKGFQTVKLMEEGRLGESEPYLQWLKDQGIEPIDSIWSFDGENMVFMLDDHLHYEHWIASEATDFITKSVDNNEPFFAWVSFQGPHTPYNPPKGVKGKVDVDKLPPPVDRPEGETLCPTHVYRTAYLPIPQDPEEVLRERIAYAESIVNIDNQVGCLLGQLEELGIVDQTSIIFSADHGDLLGDFKSVGKGPFAYSSQLDIPLILSNHTKIEPGSRSSSLSSNLDIPTTVLEIAGAEEGLCMSLSLLDLAQIEPNQPRSYNFSEYGDGIKLVEAKNFRYAYYPFLDFAELFDLAKDPQQLNNLAGQDSTRDVEIDFLRKLNDFALVCKGVEIPGFDLIPPIQEQIRKLHPRFDQPGEFKAAFPLNKYSRANLREAGMIDDYTKWFKGHKIKAHYGYDFDD